LEEEKLNEENKILMDLLFKLVLDSKQKDEDL